MPKQTRRYRLSLLKSVKRKLNFDDEMTVEEEQKKKTRRRSYYTTAKEQRAILVAANAPREEPAIIQAKLVSKATEKRGDINGLSLRKLGSVDQANMTMVKRKSLHW